MDNPARDKITEFMKEFEDYKPNGRIIKKTKEAVEEERLRQLQLQERLADKGIEEQ